MKGRFSAIDIRASVQDIREKIIGLRLQNIYDINSKTFLLKFSQPDRKEFLVVESGIRIHLTQFSREKAVAPSSFCIKLRKHLRTRRLTNVRQVGVDRIVHFEFATSAGVNAPGTFHLICEFYASGNVILTDHEYSVISLLRVVKQTKPKEIEENLNKNTANGSSQKKKDASEENAFTMAVKNVYDFAQLSRKFEPANISKAINKFQELIQVTDTKSEKGGKKSKPDLLKVLINDIYLFGPPLTEHVLLEVGLNPEMTIKSTDFDLSENSQFLAKLEEALRKADDIIMELDSHSPKGYIIMDDKANKKHTDHVSQDSDENEPDSTLFKEYHPFLFSHFKSKPYKEFPSFVEALDQFFSKIEGQKAIQRAKAQEQAAKAKLEAIKSEQMGRVNALANAEIQNRYIAELIEYNLELIDQIILVVRSLLASGMDWEELKDMIRDETRKGNLLASHITGLNLKHNQIQITLYDNEEEQETEAISDSEYDSDEDLDQVEKKRTAVPINIDLGLSAHANASRYYTIKKHSAIKKEKTLAVAETAFKNAEMKVQNDLKELKQNKPNVGVNKIRKPFWFEKFMWFISSEGYLVIAGRDVQQNELLVKKYLNKGDIYIHADMHGAATVIVKNPSQGTIPPSTLSQAGTMSVCYSRAWESKILTSAWWVFHHQVSKSAPTGEYLPTGSFMIRGKKNFLAPAALTYGFGIMYLLDENSTKRRLQERLKREAERERGPLEDDLEKDVKSDSKKYNNIGDMIENYEDKVEEHTNKDKLEINKLDKEVEMISNQEPSISELFRDPKETTVEVGLNNSQVEDKYGLTSAQLIQDLKKIKINEEDSEELEKVEDIDSSVIAKLLNPEGSNEKGTGKKRMSAKERRDLKKNAKATAQKQLDVDQDIDTNSSSLSPESNTKDKKEAIQDQKIRNPEPTQLKRGQKAKLKKIQAKYGDQDEEEKELRMKLLGSNKGPQPKGKKEKKLAEQKRLKEEYLATKALKEEKLQNDAERQLENDIDGVSKDESYEQSIIDSIHGDGAEEIKALLAEENVIQLDEEESENLLLYVDGLVGELNPDDIAEFMVPVSAPYSALNKLKYKIKLQPGTMKKGQAVKAALNHFLAQNDVTKLDQQLFKVIPHQDAINVMLGKAKVVAPSLAAAKKNQNAKAAKKKAKQRVDEE